MSESGLQYTPYLFILPNSLHCEWQYKWQNILELHIVTDPIPQPVPATAPHQVTNVSIIKDTTNLLYNLLIPAAGLQLHLYRFPYKTIIQAKKTK